jgi:hypothetical protein
LKTAYKTGKQGVSTEQACRQKVDRRVDMRAAHGHVAQSKLSSL